MPISRYDIVCATHPCHLNDLMADGGYVAIGYIYSAPEYGLQAAGVGSIDPWGSVTDYELIQAKYYRDLIPLVNAKIAQGYQPIGGLALWSNAFIQAVGKIDETGSGGGSGDGDLPSGNAFQVLGFDANKDLKAVHSGMAQWLGEDRQVGGNAADFIPVVYLTGSGQRVSQGVPSLMGLAGGPLASTVAVRDSGGILSGATATNPTHLPNLKQVQEMIDDAGTGSGSGSGELPDGKAYQVLAYAGNGSPRATNMSMEIWAGKALAKYDAAMEFVPSTMFSAGGATADNVMRHITADPLASTIAFRDAFGRLGVAEAIYPQNAVNLKQLDEIITERLKTFQDNIIDFINNGGSK